MQRVFDICHGCRRCFNLCDSFPAPVRPDRRQSPTGRARRRRERGLRAGRRRLHALRHVLHDQVPLCAAARVRPRFPASDAALPRGRARAGQGAVRRRAAGQDRPQRQAGRPVAPLANWADERDNKLTRPAAWRRSPDVDRDAALPKFHGQHLRARAKREPPAVNRAAPAYRAQGGALRHLLRQLQQPRASAWPRAPCWRTNGVETEVVYPRCCGMPQLEQGDLAKVAEARATVADDAAALDRQGLRRRSRWCPPAR